MEYAVRTDALDMTRAEAEDARRLARQAHGERIVIAAAARIAEAVRAHPDQQTIYFAQERPFSRPCATGWSGTMACRSATWRSCTAAWTRCADGT